MLKFLLILLLVAVAIYLAVRLTERRGNGRKTAQRPSRPRREPPRIVAPDDDPEFLRDLERKRRQKDEPESPA